jgi:O-antigen/teichoic acid export membrane protein
MNQTRPTDARDTAVDESKRQVSISQTERGQASPEEGGWSSLWDAFARGVRDNIVGEAVVQILRIGGLIFLARALRPQDFGLFKVLAVIGMFGILFAEAGIPEALIQRADLRREHEVTAWWSTLAIAFALVTALYLGAPWLASFMGMKELIVGTRLLCIPLLLQGVAVCAHARLRRELRFGVIAAANVLAEIMFITVALALLFDGLPQWSLPAALSMRFGVNAIVILVADARLPLGLPRLRAALDLARFSGTVLAGGLITGGAGNVDYLLVGRLLGGTALGFYAMAWDLFRFIPDRLYRIAGMVAFPAFCKLQENDHELAMAYRNFVNYIGRVVLPVLGCVAIAAPELLASIYGAKWLPAAMPMRVLAVGLALLGLKLAIGTVYYAKGYPSFDIYLNGVSLVLIIAAIGLTAPMGLLAVCGAISLVEASISIVGQYVVCLLVGMSLRELAPALIPGLRITAACAAATVVGKLAGAALSIHPPLLLAFVAAPPAIVFCWLQVDEVRGMIRRAVGGGGGGVMDVAET